MILAKIKAIYQMFNIRLKFPEELGQMNETIMYAIERLIYFIYLYKILFYTFN